MSAQPLLARALTSGAQVPGDATSSRILDAALVLAAASGLRHLTMEDVAQRAGVGRMTVYRRFGSRDELVEALAVRECRAGLDRVAGAIDPGAPLEGRVAAGFAAALGIAREHPLLVRLARVEPEAVLRTLTADGSLVMALLRDFLAGQMRAARRAGELRRGVDPDEAAELLLRIGLSFVLLPDTAMRLGDDADARRLARSLIAPLVARGQ